MEHCRGFHDIALVHDMKISASEEYELQKDEEDPDDDAVTRWVLDPNFVLHMEQQKMPHGMLSQILPVHLLAS